MGADQQEFAGDQHGQRQQQWQVEVAAAGKLRGTCRDRNEEFPEQVAERRISSSNLVSVSEISMSARKAPRASDPACSVK